MDFTLLEKNITKKTMSIIWATEKKRPLLIFEYIKKLDNEKQTEIFSLFFDFINKKEGNLDCAKFIFSHQFMNDENIRRIILLTMVFFSSKKHCIYYFREHVKTNKEEMREYLGKMFVNGNYEAFLALNNYIIQEDYETNYLISVITDRYFNDNESKESKMFYSDLIFKFFLEHRKLNNHQKKLLLNYSLNNSTNEKGSYIYNYYLDETLSNNFSFDVLLNKVDIMSMHNTFIFYKYCIKNGLTLDKEIYKNMFLFIISNQYISQDTDYIFSFVINKYPNMIDLIKKNNIYNDHELLFFLLYEIIEMNLSESYKVYIFEILSKKYSYSTCFEFALENDLFLIDNKYYQNTIDNYKLIHEKNLYCFLSNNYSKNFYFGYNNGELINKVCEDNDFILLSQLLLIDPTLIKFITQDTIEYMNHILNTTLYNKLYYQDDYNEREKKEKWKELTNKQLSNHINRNEEELIESINIISQQYNIYIF
jgi:hypothetical protein